MSMGPGDKACRHRLELRTIGWTIDLNLDGEMPRTTVDGKRDEEVDDRVAPLFSRCSH